MKKIYITLLCALLVTSDLLSQAPNWTVNSNDFENSMAVVAVVLVDGVELTSANNMIGAFVGTELRGVANTSFVNSDNRNVAHILVWSNMGAGETITFKMYDAGTDIIFASVNTLEFVNDGTEGSTAVPYVVKDNNAPTEIELSANMVDENLAVGTVVGQFSSTDLDTGETFTYSLVSGEGDENNAAFTIEDENLKTSESFDFEDNDTYSIRIQSTDSRNGSFNQQFTVSIGDANDDPADLSIFSTTLDENVAVGTFLTDLSSTDEDVEDTFTYSLVSGDGSEDNAAFAIEGAALKTNTSINFEVKDSYSIRIQTEDSEGVVFSKAFVIAINDLNDAPTEISLTINTFNENQEVGLLIADFISTDEDPTDVHLYSFLSTGSNDNEDFTIIDNQLFTKTTFDFEERETYFINVESDDQNGGVIEQQLTLTVTDFNDGPSAVDISNTDIEEKLVVGSLVGMLETTDQDAGDTFTYSLVDGIGNDDNSSFQIVDNELQSNAVFDFETKQDYSIRVGSEDSGGAVFEIEISIKILDGNDDPTDIMLSSTNVDENVEIGTVVADITTEDQDEIDSYTYSLVSGIGSEDNADFAIVEAALKTNISINFEEKDSYSIRIQTEDSKGMVFSKAFVITVNDSNDAPTEVSISINTFNENQEVGSLITDIVSTDEDPADVHVYSFVSTGSNDNEDFTLINNQLFTKSTFDFESRETYFINVQSDDQNGGLVEEQFTLSVIDQNDAPTAIDISNSTLEENLPVGSVVGIFETTDQDVGNTFTYSLVAGTGADDNSTFQIVDNELQSSAIFDFETSQIYNVRIETKDNDGGTAEESFFIEVVNENDVPTDIILDNSTVPENLSLGILVGELTTLDEDEADTHFYSFVTGTDDDNNDLFSISGSKLLTKSTFDFETLKTYFIRLETNDKSGGTFQESFVISIIDTNDNPTLLKMDVQVFDENLDIGSIVGLFSIDDVDPIAPEFSLIPGTNDNDRFLIEGDALKSVEVFDFEFESQYFIDVRADDGAGGIIVNRLEITISDANDTPETIKMSSSAVLENQSIGFVVGEFTTTDQDVLDEHTYTLVASEGDNASFQVSGNELQTNEVFDFEIRNSYQITVLSTDIAGSTVEATFTIEIDNAGDAPTDILITSTDIDEEGAVGTVVGELSTIDEDSGDTFTYSLISGEGDTDNGDFDINGANLVSKTVFDAETQTAYSVRVNVEDSYGNTISKSYAITILLVNESPEIEEQEFSVLERSTVGTSVGTVEASDIDGDVLSFSMGDNNVPFELNSSTGEISVVQDAIDYEEATSYTLEIQVTDPGGLSDIAVIIILIEDIIETELPLPANDFVSANNDGFNDVFIIQNASLYQDYTLIIFNNAGTEVFSMTGYNNTWSGTDNSGHELASGAYYYSFISPSNPISFKGSLTLVR